jgi:uncharacterized damage-inducible protein DinB
MNLIELFLQEIESEAVITRRMFERLPDDKFDWKPHEKNMTMQRLAAHIAELPGWVTMGITTSELDFAKGEYKPELPANKKELLEYFERMLSSGIKTLKGAKEEQLNGDWTMRNGDQVFFTISKAQLIRTSISQTIHHRAQLGVYLRLLNIPVPGSYGPSADESNFF